MQSKYSDFLGIILPGEGEKFFYSAVVNCRVHSVTDAPKNIFNVKGGLGAGVGLSEGKIDNLDTF